MRQSFKRFYKDVSLGEDPGEAGWRLLLDGKPVRTPAGRHVVIAHRPLAEAIAAEWEAQSETAHVTSMPTTRLAMSVIDHVSPRMAEVREEALGYGMTDLLCYRATEPEKLARQQASTWQPYLDWAAETLGARLEVSTGLRAIDHGSEALARLKEAVGAFGPYRLLVLQGLTTRFGSLVLALAVLHGRLLPSEALGASRLDELFQAEIWGLDEAAEQRAAIIAREVEDFTRFLSLLA